MHVGTEVVLANLANILEDGVTRELLNQYSLKLSEAIVKGMKNVLSVYINIDNNNINATLALYRKFFYMQDGKYFIHKNKPALEYFNSMYDAKIIETIVSVAKKVKHENIQR
jgi:hypothetical protein